MDKPNITEGEWEIIETKDNNLLIVADDLIVCRINELAELTNPNAQAISAVPEMIDALIEIIDNHTVQTSSDMRRYKKVKSALEKAGVEL